MISEAPEIRPLLRSRVGLDADRSLLLRCLTGLALCLMLVSIWALMHRYRGVTGDAELYAVQALSRLDPSLANDFYLQGGSQDRYTIFSPLYATVIAAFGLRDSALGLTALFTVWFLTAAWFLAKVLTDRRTAWLSVAALVILTGRYGGYGVFHYLEVFLTARSLAEALLVTAFACHFAGRRGTALLLGAGCMFVHPLMTLPALLLLICLWLPGRYSLAGAVCGVLSAALMGLLPKFLPPSALFFTVMDAPWLEVVRERSQFLFLQIWKLGDWKLNVRGFVSLAFTALAVADPRVRKLCGCAALVGAAGLLVALIASTLSPVAILLQGQAWRWMWVTTFFAILLLPVTVWRVYRDEKCGPLCAIIIVCSWTFTPIDTLWGMGLATLLWCVREHISPQMSRFLRLIALAFALIALAWILGNAWTIISAPSPEAGRESLWASRLRNILGLDISAVLLFGLFWYWMGRQRNPWLPGLAAAALAALSVWVLPGAFSQVGYPADPKEIASFAPWRRAIPPGSNVFILSKNISTAMVWFDLQRPSYVTTDQSAGVVFSRATALEVARRAAVVSPVLDPTWRIMSQIAKNEAAAAAAEAAGSAAKKAKDEDKTIRPLTRDRLIAICRDPLLGFVVAKDLTDFEPLTHRDPGPWKDWHLYDCRRVRAAGQPP